MKFAELLALGRRMNAEERAADLRSLVNDPRFAALVGVIDDDKAQFITQGSQQKLAPHHGSLAHCMGSIHALEVLESQIKQISDSPPPAPPPEL